MTEHKQTNTNELKVKKVEFSFSEVSDEFIKDGVYGVKIQDPVIRSGDVPPSSYFLRKLYGGGNASEDGNPETKKDINFTRLSVTTSNHFNSIKSFFDSNKIGCEFKDGKLKLDEKYLTDFNDIIRLINVQSDGMNSGEFSKKTKKSGPLGLGHGEKRIFFVCDDKGENYLCRVSLSGLTAEDTKWVIEFQNLTENVNLYKSINWLYFPGN